MDKKDNVLFLCTGNSARSQMAEAFLRYYANETFNVYSAGLNPQGINPYTVRIMDEIGIDIRHQTSESVKDYMGKMHFKYVITVCSHADQNCPTPLWAYGIKLHFPFDDPAATIGTDDQIMSKFREVRNQIQAKIQEWLKNVNQPAGSYPTTRT